MFLSTMMMGALGLGSLLSADRVLRTPIGRRWIGSDPLSDTTMARSLECFETDSLRPLLLASYQLGKHQCKATFKTGKKRIGIVDGSGFGRLLASCFSVVGDVSLMVGLYPYEKQGKELPAGYALLRQLKQELGPRFVDIILGDGLYLNEPFFNLCLNELESDVLVKTDDQSREIIQDAKGLFESKSVFVGQIPTVCGIDDQRMVSYQVTMAGGFQLSGVNAELNVAQVSEKKIKTGESQTFWVVTSADDLTPEEVRELAHQRWEVENNGFKALNATVVTKRIYSHDSTAQEAVLLTLFIVFNLLMLFFAKTQSRLNQFVGVKLTRKLAIELLRVFLWVFAFIEEH